MKLVLQRLALIEKIESEIERREKEAAKFNEGIEERWIKKRASAILKARKDLEKIQTEEVKMPAFKLYRERYHGRAYANGAGEYTGRERGMSLEVPQPEHPQTADVSDLKTAMGLLKLAEGDTITIDNKRDYTEIGAVISQLFG